MASLLKHFHHKSKQKPPVLPDLKDSLSEKVASSIELTNSIIHNVQSQAWQEDNAAPAWGVLEFNFRSEVLNRQVCCQRWSNSNSTILFQAFAHDSPNSPIFLWYSSFGDLPIYYRQSFIMQVFINILPYQYFFVYGILVHKTLPIIWL